MGDEDWRDRVAEGKIGGPDRGETQRGGELNKRERQVIGWIVSILILVLVFWAAFVVFSALHDTRTIDRPSHSHSHSGGY